MKKQEKENVQRENEKNKRKREKEMKYRIIKTWTACKEWTIEAANYQEAQKLVCNPDFEELDWDDDYSETAGEWTIEVVGE